MGCWGFGIMQSDDALDAEIDIMEAINLSWADKNKNKVSKLFLNNFDKIADVCRFKNYDNYSQAVYWQVFAHSGMKFGTQFTEEQQKQIIQGVTTCEEYIQGKKFPNKEDLHEHIKKEQIKEFGEQDWNQRSQIWGEESNTDRVIERTKNIDQLVQDFKEFAKNGFIPFERKEDGLLDTMKKKRKI